MTIHSNPRILDLTSANQLNSWGLVPEQLCGTLGRPLLEELKRKAPSIGYEGVAFREPLRPGQLSIELFSTTQETNENKRWNFHGTVGLIQKHCPHLISMWSQETRPGSDWDMVYPPIGLPSLVYAQILEGLIHLFPQSVVAWFEAYLTYSNDLKIHGIESLLLNDARSRCPHAGILEHLLVADIAS